MPEAVSADVLNLTQADRRKPVVATMVQDVPFFKRVYENKGFRSKFGGGSSIEIVQAGQSPSQGIGIFGGSEVAPVGRSNIVNKGQTELHHLMVVIAIPKQDLIANDGPMAVEKLWDLYVKMTVLGINRDLETYLLTGTSEGNVFSTTALSGLLSFNGQFTSGARIGVENGALQFLATGSQTGTMLGIARSSTYKWFNQYGLVTAIDQDFESVLGTTVRQASRHVVGNPTSARHMVFADSTSFQKLHQYRTLAVRATDIDSQRERDNFYSVKVGNTEVFETPDINLALYSGDAANGLMLGINSQDVEVVMSGTPELSDFYDDKVFNQDVVVCKYTMRFQIILKNLPSHFALAGTAR